ncbi:Crp/Fnr family transcriptional regulator [Tabrizicola sp.]|uniref:Crp/Fnr family transcriptional regulator n=1 Tax=Tabrizicola sp. TaxID=2005166 RepID=UPI002869F431|nr:Crp/Fnr family transcriptional regulator [Tabrizicola sp.]
MNLSLETGAAAQSLIAALRGATSGRTCWRPRSCARSAVIFAQGDLVGGIFVLQKGLVKLTYGTADGEEWIKSFIVDTGVFAATDGDDSTSSYAARCLEPSEVVCLPRNMVTQAVSGDPAVQRAYLDFTAWVMRRKQAREAALLGASPEARYRHLQSTSAGILARLPQGDIARYLGVTPIAFSRIKRRIADADQSGAISPSARIA